ncbi:MAG: tetratricopeptide repeat protein [Bacteroidales bacterium]
MKRLTCIVHLLILLGQAVTAQDQSPPVELIKARYLLSINDFEGARLALDQLNPDAGTRDLFTLTNGMVLVGLGEKVAAEQWLLQVGGELSARASYQLARLYALENEPEKATDHLARHLASENRYPEVQIKTDPAFASIEESRPWIRLWQRDWYSDYENLLREGDYLLSRDDPEGASKIAEQLLLMEPLSAETHFLKARLEYGQGKRKQASQLLDRSIQLGGARTVLLERILQFCMDTRDFERVNSVSSRLIRLDPSNPDYYFSRALGRIAEGKESMVAREMEAISAIGIAPAELFYQAALRLTGSTPDRAEQYLNQAIESGTLDARFYYLRGSVRNTLGKHSLALDDMAMSLDINPNQPDLYFERAEIRLSIGDTEGACHDWRKSLSQGNRNAPDRLYKYCR